MQEHIPKRKLLLADDSVTIQKVVNLTFADEGIEVVSVGDGNSAMERLLEDSPDIVLADVNMPGLTGYEICAKIKERDIEDQIPVVLLVGSFEPFDEEEAERVGADGYLTKPFQSISQLVDKVAELLGTGAAETVPFMDFEPAEENQAFVGSPADDSDLEPMAGLHDFVEMDADPVDDYSGRPTIEEENTFADFQDADEFEMSEAFGDDPEQAAVVDHRSDDQQVEEVPGDFLKTQPLTESDLQEILVESESGQEFRAEDDSGVEESSQDYDEAAFFPMDEEEYSPNDEFEAESPEPESASFGDFASETHDSEAAAQNFEFGENASEFRETPSEFRETPREFTETASEFTETASEYRENASAFETLQPDFPMPEGASVLNLDEINLLELPPVDTNNSEAEEDVGDEYADTMYEDETEIAEPEIYNTVAEEDDFDEGSDIVVETPSGPAADPVALRQSVDQALSKDMVEAITQRVIETLSEKAIRDIAWEVVPDLADLIIKKMAEEKMKN